MKVSRCYRIMLLFVLGILCLCVGCTRKNGNRDSSEIKDNSHNFSKSVIEVSYDSNHGAIAGDGFLFSIEEKTKEATLISYYDVELLEVTLPDAVLYEDTEYPVTSIGESAFESDQSIVKIQMGKNIRSIQASAFYAAAALEEVVFQDSLTTIGERAFASCSALKKISWGTALETVGNSAFEGDEELQTLQLPKSVINWGSEVFMDCSGLAECTFEEGSSSIGEGMFTNCASLKKISIPDSVTIIGAAAFWSCSELQELSLPDTVSMIGDQAFYSTGIQNLRLPSRLSAVKLELLDGMDSLSGISVPETRKKDYENIFHNYGIEIAAY